MNMKMGRMARTWAWAMVHVYGWNQDDYLRTVHGAQWMCSVEYASCGVTQAWMSSFDVCVVQCHAIIHVVIGVRIVLCSTFLAFYFVPNSHCCNAVVIHQTFTCSHFFTCFAPYSRGIWGVVFTPVGYNRPTSAVNDPTVTKQVNSGKSCLEELFRLLV